eukprot:2981918-Amphidinium_carterae.3
MQVLDVTEKIEYFLPLVSKRVLFFNSSSHAEDTLTPGPCPEGIRICSENFWRYTCSLKNPWTNFRHVFVEVFGQVFGGFQFRFSESVWVKFVKQIRSQIREGEIRSLSVSWMFKVK